MAKTVVGLGIIGVIIFIVVLFGMPVYNYHVFKSDLSEVSTWDTDVRIPDKRFKERVMKYAEESNIPIKEEDITIFQEKDKRDIAVSWTQTVNFFDLYEKTYEFNIDTRYKEK